MSAGTFYGPRPEARKDRALHALRASAAELQRKIDQVALMTPEQFEMEIRLQLMWLTCGVNEFHESVREEQMVKRRMQKAGWLV